jgi:ABC-2 type transport system ATP-binding protein
MGAPAIRTEGLTRSFGSVRAVDGLTLEVPRGIVFGFLAPNGGGKTTTIRLLLGLLEPDAGRAEVLGLDVAREADAVRAKCGALLEFTGLYERLSAEENLAFYARAWHLPKDAREARVRELLDHIGLWDRRHEAIGTWSRGMKQKLAVVRTLLHKPELVFLDEPTAGLDAVASASLRADLESLARKEGVTIFLTTHNLSEAERLCARVGVVRQGRLLAVGSPAELRASRSGERLDLVGRGFPPALVARLQAAPGVAGVEARADRLSLRLLPGAASAPLLRAAIEAGAEVEEARREGASLEDVFLKLVEEEPT